MKAGVLIIMDKILFNNAVFAERLTTRRKACGYTSKTAFAKAFHSRFRNGDQLAGNTPYSGTYATIKNYENPKYTGSPSLDIVVQICQLLDCDIDYLLGFIDEPKHIYQATKEQFGLSNEATNRLIYWNKRHVNYSGVLNHVLESANFENALHHAIRLMKVKPVLDGLRQTRQEWLRKTFSGPPDCGTAYNYPGDNGLADAISEKEKEYASQRLYLDEYFTFLIQELEKIAVQKAQKKQD